jgi:hypothetical protein
VGSKINLYVTPYQEKNPDRAKELRECLLKNFEAGFNRIVCVVEDKDFDFVRHEILDLLGESNLGSAVLERTEGRPTFSDYISIANEYDEDTIHVVCNADIYLLPKTLEQLKDLPWEKKKLFIGLSRWDQHHSGKLVHLSRWDSQDSFIWKGRCPITTQMCPLGWPGSDNSALFHFKNAGYSVYNPSNDIQTVHLHNVQIYNYRQDSKVDGAIKGSQLCAEPYHLCTPCNISDIK